jgi:phospho-N-acetylmuramoyl-pentapeptide-transferase
VVIPETFIVKLSTILFLSFVTFVVAMLLTPLYTAFAFRFKLWKQERTHDTSGKPLEVVKKQYRRTRPVPAMAGLIIIVSVTIVTVLFNLNRQQTWLPLAALLGGAFVGLIDDIINVKGKGGGVAGLRAPIKFFMIADVAAIGAWFFYYKLGYSAIHMPVLGDVTLGWWLIPLFILVVVSTGNAVNISDGRDGLAGGLLASAYGAFGTIAFLQGNFGIAAFCFTIVGATLAYLWFNIAPARFFMGDVGSFGLGTALGVVAMLTNTLFLLPLIGVVFVAEAGSSLIQIASKKFFHRKVFIAAPIHHHLEELGWQKNQVVMRFWVVGQVCAALGIILALTGGYIR